MFDESDDLPDLGHVFAIPLRQEHAQEQRQEHAQEQRHLKPVAPSVADAPVTPKQPKSEKEPCKDETPIFETWDGALPSAGSWFHVQEQRQEHAQEQRHLKPVAPFVADAPVTPKQPESERDPCKDETPIFETWDGALPSAGSRLHGERMCRPCHFVKHSCVLGADCSFCHFAHPHKSKTRPCKTKRERFRRQVSKMEHMIRANPDIDHGSIALPEALQAIPELKANFDRRLASFAASQQAGEGSQEARSTLAQSSMTSIRS